MQIEILVFPGVDELDVLGPFEVFRTAHHLSVGSGLSIDARLVTLAEQSEILGSHGLSFRPDGVVGSAGRPDLLVVPGGGWNARAAAGAWGEAQRGDAPRAIERFYRQGVILASVCTGAMLLAAAGLTRDRHLVTHHRALDELRYSGARVIDGARVVDDGDIVSAGGVTSGLDLALYLVERFVNAAIADKVASELEYGRTGLLWIGGKLISEPITIQGK